MHVPKGATKPPGSSGSWVIAKYVTTEYESHERISGVHNTSCCVCIFPQSFHICSILHTFEVYSPGWCGSQGLFFASSHSGFPAFVKEKKIISYFLVSFFFESHFLLKIFIF